MKKTLSIIIAICMIMSVATVLCAVSASADAPVASEIRLVCDDGSVKVRDGADMSVLCDGLKHKNYATTNPTSANFDRPGIVLIQNTESVTPKVYDVCNLVIDLGKTTNVDTVNIAFYHFLNAMIGTPKDGDITISYSPDGNDFSEIGTFKMENEANDQTVDGIFDEYFYLGKIYSCRAIMVSMAYGDSPYDSKPVTEWFGFTELSAGLKLDYDSVDEDSEEPEVSEEPKDPMENVTLPEGADKNSACATAKLNSPISDKTQTLITDLSKLGDMNLNWATSVLLAPAEGGNYTVAEIITSPQGTPSFTTDVSGDGYLVFALHGGDGSDTECAEYKLYTYWKTAEVGTEVAISGYDLAAGKMDEGAYICALGTGNGGDEVSGDTSSVTSNEVSETESKNESTEDSKTESNTESKNESGDVSAPKQEGGSNLTWLYIVIAVVVVAAAAGVAVVLVKKKTK